MKLERVFSSKFILTLLILTLLFSISVAFFLHPDAYHSSKFSVFVTILASLAITFIGLSLVVSAMTYEKTIQTNRINFTKQAIDKLWLYPNQLLASSNPILSPRFLKSLYPNNLKMYAASDSEVPRLIAEQNAAIVLIQAWEDFLTMHSFDKTGTEVWLVNFLQWAQSPELKGYFDFLKYNFKGTTIQFGDLLFHYASRLPIPTADPELYEKTAALMLEDTGIQSLLNQ